MHIFEFDVRIHSGIKMAEQLDDNELVSFKEMLIANSIQMGAICQLLIEKGIIAEEEFYSKLKEVQAQYQNKKGDR